MSTFPCTAWHSLCRSLCSYHVLACCPVTIAGSHNILDVLLSWLLASSLHKGCLGSWFEAASANLLHLTAGTLELYSSLLHGYDRTRPLPRTQRGTSLRSFPSGACAESKDWGVRSDGRS